MRWYKLLYYYLWIAPHVLLAVVAVLLWVRRLYTGFPIFALYTLYEIAEFALLFPIALTRLSRGPFYIWVFLATMAIGTALRFGILQEIFDNIFREHREAYRVGRASLRWTTGILLATAVLCSVVAPGQPSDNLLLGAAWLGRGVAIVQCGLVLFLLLFSRLLGMSLHGYVFGIALGFGVLSTVEIADWAIPAEEFTKSQGRLLHLLPMAGYHVAVLLWLGYLAAPANRVGPPGDVPMGAIDQWNTELERFLG